MPIKAKTHAVEKVYDKSLLADDRPLCMFFLIRKRSEMQPDSSTEGLQINEAQRSGDASRPMLW